MTGLLCDRTNPKALLQCDGRPEQALTVTSRFNLEAVLAFNLFFMQHGTIVNVEGIRCVTPEARSIPSQIVMTDLVEQLQLCNSPKF